MGGYNYETEKPSIFTEDGVKRLLEVRDKVGNALKEHGAFRLQELKINSWEEIACGDYLVEQKEIVELARDCWGQYRVFTTPEVHNL